MTTFPLYEPGKTERSGAQSASEAHKGGGCTNLQVCCAAGLQDQVLQLHLPDFAGASRTTATLVMKQHNA